MRAFILLLVLLNILFFLWGEYVYVPPRGPSAEYISPDTDKLQLASEAATPVLPEPTEKATDDPEKKPPALTPEMVEVPKVIEEKIEENVVEADTTSTAEEPPTAVVDTPTETDETALVKEPSVKEPPLKPSDKCFTAGPFDTDQMLDEAINHLAEQGIISPTQRTLEEQEISSYRVFIPQTDHPEKLNASIKALRSKGFNEFYVMTEPGMENAISLGLFRGRINAAKQVKRLKAAGLNGELKTRYRDKQYHWLDYTDNNNLINNILLQSWFPNEALQLLSRECE